MDQNEPKVNAAPLSIVQVMSMLCAAIYIDSRHDLTPQDAIEWACDYAETFCEHICVDPHSPIMNPVAI